MLQEEIKQRHQQNLFAQHLRVEILDKGHGSAKVQIQSQELHANPNGQVHGGALFTLADIAAGTACVGDGYKVTTVNSTVNFMRPGQPGDTLIAYAKVIKDGRTIMVVDSNIYNQDQEHLCHGTFTFYKIYPTVED